MTQHCERCGMAVEANTPFCINCGSAVSPETQSYRATQIPTYETPMKWFKFVIYVQLFVAFVVNAFMGVINIMGGQSKYVYSNVPSMKTLDGIYGVILIALAVYAIVVRFRLSKFRANGPRLYYAYLIAEYVLPIVYTVATIVIIKNSPVVQYFQPNYISVLSNLIMGIIMLTANFLYFSKRDYLFINP